jgi:hypothetical protein
LLGGSKEYGSVTSHWNLERVVVIRLSSESFPVGGSLSEVVRDGERDAVLYYEKTSKLRTGDSNIYALMIEKLGEA